MAPDVVYTSVAGFDPRYSGVGMFGVAYYFAERALYSDTGYRYNVPGVANEAQMFLARIVAGKVEHRPADSKIKHPSPGFDSVRGLVRSPDFYAYMLYETRMSYPAYLITYATK